MPKELDGYPLLLSLLLRESCYEQVLKNQRNFSVLAERGGSEALRLYWRYCEKFKEAPKGRKALEEFATQQPKTTLEQVAPELDAAEAVPPSQVTDFNATFSQAWQEASTEYMLHMAGTAARIASGESSNSLKKRYQELYGEDESKWDRVAMAEMITREKMADNPFKDQGDVAGGTYQENTERVRERILEAFAEEDDNGALLTGFPAIDENVTIGTGFQHLRFVGIAGQSGRGKTLILLTLAYNLARQGKNVLYNSLEHGYEDTWALMAFLHSSYFSDQGRFNIPPLSVWVQGNRAANPATQCDLENFDIIQEDARSRRGLPGWIDACQFDRWDDIVARVEGNYKEISYDVVIVDYLEGLKDAQSKYKPDDEYVKLMYRVKRWTRTFNNNKGIVVMSPLTITKEGAKQAEELDAEQPEIPFKDTAIRGASQILYEMDLAIGVHSTEEMREKHEMLMWGLKIRHGKQPPPLTLLKVDPLSKHAWDPRGETGKREVRAITKADEFSFAEELSWQDQD